MRKAWDMGIIDYSPHQVRSNLTFNRFVDYQEAIGEKNIFRRSHYDHLGYDDLVNHIKRIAAEEGSKPTIPTLYRRIEEGGLEEPSPTVIRRLIYPKTFYDLYRSAGLAETTHAWTNEEFELFGLSYMWANRGKVPSAAALKVLSKKKIAPTHQGVIGRYEYLSAFQDKLIDRFNSEYDQLISELRLRIERAEIPIDIINTSLDEWKVVVSYIKYKTIEEFSPPQFNQYRIFEASNILGKVTDTEFQDVYPELDIELMRLIAKENGTEGAIWPKESGLLYKVRVKKRASSFTRTAQPQNGFIKDLKKRYKIDHRQRKELERLRISLLSDSETTAAYLNKRGIEIKSALEEADIPIRLFAGSKRGKTMARRYEAYVASGKILPFLSTPDKVRISILSDTQKLSTSLRKIEESLSPDFINNTLAQLGYALID